MPYGCLAIVCNTQLHCQRLEAMMGDPLSDLMSPYFPQLRAFETLTGIEVTDLSSLVGEETEHQMAE